MTASIILISGGLFLKNDVNFELSVAKDSSNDESGETSDKLSITDLVNPDGQLKAYSHRGQ